MTQTSSSLVLGVDEFLTRYGDNPRYELADGELIEIESTGLQETTARKIAYRLGSGSTSVIFSKRMTS